MQYLGALVGFLGGLIVGFGVAFGGYFIWLTWLGGIDREGAGAMAAFFFYGPSIGFVLGIATAAAGWRLFSQ